MNIFNKKHFEPIKLRATNIQFNLFVTTSIDGLQFCFPMKRVIGVANSFLLLVLDVGVICWYHFADYFLEHCCMGQLMNPKVQQGVCVKLLNLFIGTFKKCSE